MTGEGILIQVFSNSDVHERILAGRAKFARFAIAKLALVLALWTILIAAPLAAQNTLTASEANLRIYAYRISLENTQEREKLGLIAAELRTRAERAEARWRTSSRQLSAERERGELQQARISELEDQAASDKAEFAASITELTDTLAEKDRDFRAKLELALLDGSDYQETEAGRKALALFAEGGIDNISEGLDILDEVLALEDQIAAFERAARYRRAARTRLGVRGIHTATTDRIIQLYEEVVEYDPQSSPDWLELARLYRDARLVDKAIEAADNAVRFSNGDAERGYALFERAEVQYLNWINQDSFAPGKRLIEIAINPEEIPTFAREEGIGNEQEFMVYFVDAFVTFAAPEGDAERIKQLFLESAAVIGGVEDLSPVQRSLFVGRANLRALEAQYFIVRAGLIDIAAVELRRMAGASGDFDDFEEQLSGIDLEPLNAIAVKDLEAEVVELQRLMGSSQGQLLPLLVSGDPLVTATALSSFMTSVELLLQLQSPSEGMLNSIQGMKLQSDVLLTDYPDLVAARKLSAQVASLLAKTSAQLGRIDQASQTYEEVSSKYDQLVGSDSYSANLRVARLIFWIEARSFGLGDRDWAAILAEETELREQGLLAPDDEARILFSQAMALSKGQIGPGSTAGSPPADTGNQAS